MLSCIPLFPWIFIIGLEFMMTTKKIKTEDHDWDKKKFSQKSSYPWKSLVCVASKQLPHQNMNSVPFPMPLWCQRNCACYSKSFRCIEGIISTWEMALFWIIRTSDSKYTRMITLFWVTSWFYKTIYGATPSGFMTDRVIILSLSSPLWWGPHRDYCHWYWWYESASSLQSLTKINEDLFPVNISGIVSALLNANSIIMIRSVVPILSFSSTLEKSRQIVKKI